MTGQDRGTDAGTYVATYTPDNGYVWSDGTTESITVVLTIYSPSLEIWSPNAFIVAAYDSSAQSFIKGWNGIIEYSTNTTTWTNWNGATEYLTASLGSDNNYHLYLRGTGNTYLNTNTESTALNDMWVFYKPDMSGQISDVHLVGNMEILLDY